MITIVQIPNSPISSNSYLVYDIDSSSCIIIDPGTFDETNVLTIFLEDNGLNVKYVILTHEHFDHIAGVINLQKNFQFDLICSKYTAIGLTDPKRNLSAFSDQIKPIIITQKPTILNNSDLISLLGLKFQFFNTPGHSAGSMCFLFDQHFFSGDTLLNELKTRLNLPGSDKNQYKLSLEKINHFLKHGMRVYPGHGDSFIY